jgi:phage terminase small subunit
MPLLLQQERFCQEYMVDGNATAAYIRAGYKGRGATASVNSSRMLRNAKIAARLQELNAAKSHRLSDLGDRVMIELSKIAFANVPDSVEWVEEENEEEIQGRYRIKSLAELGEDIKASISEIRVNRYGATVRLYDKIRALEVIAKILGLTSDINIAIATLRKYGINVVQENGEWKIADTQYDGAADAGELEGTEE